MNKHTVLLLKAFSWRLVGTIDTFIVSLVVTGTVSIAVTISAVEFFTKILLYYLHERAWLPWLRKL